MRILLALRSLRASSSAALTGAALLLGGALAPAAALAQPTVLWQHHWRVEPFLPNLPPYAPVPALELLNLHRLSNDRYALTGGRYFANQPGVQYPSLVRFSAAGDSISETIYPHGNWSGHAFLNTRLVAPDRLLSLAAYEDSTLGRNAVSFMLALRDTSGHDLWRRVQQPDSGFQLHLGWESIYGGLRLVLGRPSGYMSIFNQQVAQTYYREGGLQWVDANGRRRKNWRSGWADDDLVFGITPLPDGAYLAVGSVRGHDTTTTHTYFGQDYAFTKLDARLNTVATRWLGTPGHYEEAWQVYPARDGEILVVGRRQERTNFTFDPQQGPNAELILLDSLLNVKWRRQVNGDYGFGGGFESAVLLDAQPTADGGCVAIGAKLVRNFEYQALIVCLDSAGNTRWTQTYPTPWTNHPNPNSYGTSFWNWVYEPNGDAVVMGFFNFNIPGGSGEPGYGYRLLSLAGLPRPWLPGQSTPCRPPRLLHPNPATVTGPAGPNGDTYTFALDSTRVSPGLRYGILDAIVWNFGDGTPPDTGATVTHAYATPQPVRVRCTLLNNLGCTTSFDVFPLGPCPTCPTAAPGALPDQPAYTLTQNAPNPTTGATTIGYRLPATTRQAHLLLRDLTGRTLRRLPLEPTQTTATLDLRGLPTGLYTYHLLADGATRATRKLVLTAE